MKERERATVRQRERGRISSLSVSVCDVEGGKQEASLEF